MKKLIPFLVLILLASCGEIGSSEKSASNSKNVLEEFTFSIDTLMVNPGEEIINLARGIGRSGLSQDKSTMYLLDDAGGLIDVIDLEGMKLKEKLPMEKDGPNGIGHNLFTMQALPDGNFVLAGFNSAGIFTPSGEKIKDLKFTAKDIEGIDLDDDMALTNSMKMSSDGKHLFALPSSFNKNVIQLVTLNPDTKTGKMLNVPAMDKTSAFRITLKSDMAMMIYMEQIYLQEFEGNMYISNSAASEVYRYDYNKGTLQLFTFPYKIIPTEKTGIVKNQVSSQKEFDAEMAKLSDQIGFEQLMWDDQRKMFFRFARKYYTNEEKQGPYPADVYLLAYDADLNLVGEKELDELDKVPSSAFFKDGKLWSYVNVEDELGFAVFSFDF